MNKKIEFTVSHGDQIDDAAYTAIHFVNELLKEYKLKILIESDNLPHDGFEVLSLQIQQIV